MADACDILGCRYPELGNCQFSGCYALHARPELRTHMGDWGAADARQAERNATMDRWEREDAQDEHVDTVVLPPLTETQEAIIDECDRMSNLLLAKNRAYGNSATDPIRIFSRAPADEQLRTRIDDKLSRILRGLGDEEDTVTDLIGYLILYKVQRRLAKGVKSED